MAMAKDTLDIFDLIGTDLKANGYEYCDHCNGYGSSLKEESRVCTKCKGTGLQKIQKTLDIPLNV